MISRVLIRCTAATLFCLFATSALTAFAAKRNERLTVGDDAPALDIEHWLQDGNGYFKPVKKFKEGNVYVVEFWATWCDPCKISMPMLAELQNKYRGQGVQIIGVSNEPLETIDRMMEQEHGQVEKTFREITSAYSLATDPDSSVSDDYMLASGQDGVPTAFIVGKTGKIEWIGSPFKMDEPLSQVVDGTWDRASFKKQFDAIQQLEMDHATIAKLEQSGKIDEAIAFATLKAKNAEQPEIKARWTSFQHQLKLVYKKVDQDTIRYYREQFQFFRDNNDLQGLLMLGGELYGAIEMGGRVDGLNQDAMEALEAVDPTGAPTQLQAAYHNTIALLSESTGDFEKAVQQQTAAMKLLNAREQRRMMPFLKELREKAEKAKTAKKKAAAGK